MDVQRVAPAAAQTEEDRLCSVASDRPGIDPGGDPGATSCPFNEHGYRAWP
jgi:hypothetical protein